MRVGWLSRSTNMVLHFMAMAKELASMSLRYLGQLSRSTPRWSSLAPSGP